MMTWIQLLQFGIIWMFAGFLCMFIIEKEINEKLAKEGGLDVWGVAQLLSFMVAAPATLLFCIFIVFPYLVIKGDKKDK